MYLDSWVKWALKWIKLNEMNGVKFIQNLFILNIIQTEPKSKWLNKINVNVVYEVS